MDDETRLINETVRKFIRPQLALDVPVLKARLDEIVLDKESWCSGLGVTRGDLLSNVKFAALLKARNIKVPMKRSPTTGAFTFALAKNDPGFQALLFDLKSSALARARLAVKSTMEETRIKRFIAVAEATGGLLPVPLNYYAAHTGRFGGSDKLNLQNMGRKSKLRTAIIPARKGYKIVAGDLSQIEARMVAVLAGQWDLVEQFARGDDVYSLFATDHYGYPVHKDTHPDERFVGKTSILQLGFQSGAVKFYTAMNFVHKAPISEEESQRVVDTYRRKYGKIVMMWQRMKYLIEKMAKGQVVTEGPLQTGKNHIVLPNGMRLQYPDLKYNHEERQWSYRGWRGKTPIRVKLYGGKLFENIVQALARIVVTSAELHMAKHGFHAALSVHDELVYAVPEVMAERFADKLRQVLVIRPEWLPKLPLACEVKIGNNYGECK